MQERGEAGQRVITTPAASFDEGRPAEAQSAPEGGKPSITTNIKMMVVMRINSSTNMS